MKYFEFICGRDTNLVSYASFVLGRSKGFAAELLRKGDVRLDGVKIREDSDVKRGSKLGFYVTERVFAEALGEIYSDDNVFAAFKPSGIESAGDFSLEERLSALLGRSVRAVHRLDTNTKGVNLFALNDESESELLKAFRERRIDKEYRADVFGNPAGSAVLSDYLIKDPEKGLCRVTERKVRGAFEIVTGYELIGSTVFYADKSRGKQSEAVKISSLLVRPKTGRTHQIRAHLAYKGLPIVGDCKYGDYRLNRLVGETVQRLVCVSLCGDFPSESVLSYLSGKKISCQFL